MNVSFRATGERMPTEAEVRAELCGPGGPFELARESVGGIEMWVYKDRPPHLRAVAEAAQRRGDQELLVYGDETITYGEFFARVHSAANALSTHYGVRHGERVAVLSANNPEWCIAFWATVELGAVLVGLNGWWKADEILYGIRDSGARVLIADRGRFERIAGDLEHLPTLETIFLIDAEPSELGGGSQLRHFGELVSQSHAPVPEVPIAEDDPALIFYTSGTTGRPKGAVSTHRNMIATLQNTIYNNVANRKRWPELAPARGERSRTVSLMSSPLFHVSGLHSSLVVGTVGGVKLVMTKGRFEPEKVFRLIEEEKVTIWATVPTMVWRACEWEGRHRFDTSTVTTVAFGGSPASEELRRMIRETFPNVRSTSNVYGLTESSSAATICSGPDLDARPGSVGLPLPTVELRVVGSDGRDLAASQPGEILIRGPIVTPGYWGQPEASAQTVTDGWLHTGDIGYLDSDGYLYITDRAKDLIIRGGENISCVEVEHRLVEHPEVLDAAVIGVPHDELGEEVKAVVQVRPGSGLQPAAVREWASETLADFKVPAYVEITTQKLPRNPSGKLLKNVLRGEAEFQFTDSL